ATRAIPARRSSAGPGRCPSTTATTTRCSCGWRCCPRWPRTTPLPAWDSAARGAGNREREAFPSPAAGAGGGPGLRAVRGAGAVRHDARGRVLGVQARGGTAARFGLPVAHAPDRPAWQDTAVAVAARQAATGVHVLRLLPLHLPADHRGRQGGGTRAHAG